jgi:molecular chaperone IbpA
MVTSKTLSLSNFHTLAPNTVGWERHLNRLSDYHSVAQTGFPPYNIIQEGDFDYKIELALAGFSKDDIEVKVADGVLSIKSTKDNETGGEDINTLHKGISYRKFNRKYDLADDIVVKDAKLENGLLTIHLERIIPDEKKPRVIEIK